MVGEAAAVKPETARPAAVKPETSTPAAVKPETGGPAAVKSETGGPAAVKQGGGRPAAGAAGAVVAVTGAGSDLGAAVLAELARSPRIAAVAGVDRTVAAPAPDPAGGGHRAEVSWRQLDAVDPRLPQAFDGVDAVVHLAVDLRPDKDRAGQRQQNTRAAQTVLTAAFAAGVRRVVLVTSAMVYGARPDNPVPLPDDAPLRAVPEASAVGDLLEVERIAAKARRTHRGLVVTVLRPAIVLGAGDREPLATLLAAPRLLRIRGAAGHWQFCHVVDLAAAIELALLGELAGAVNVGSDGWLDSTELERITGRRGLELPERVAVGTAERLHRLGLTPAPPSELAYLIHPWVVDTGRLRDAGWRPRYTNTEAVRAHLADIAERERSRPARLDARTATAAAGAAVALVGTAALVRRARRRRGRG
jgi:nucleoside-diphosphate-sugar epimerase